MEKISDYLKIRRQDLSENAQPRVPICLCLDVSGSMGAVEFDENNNQVTRIEELQKGIEKFYREIRENEVAKYAAEICVVTFDTDAKCVLDFANINRQEVPQLKLGGTTAMGEGVNLALDLLENRKAEYVDAGTDYFQPWLVLMTDGKPNSGNRSKAELEQAMNRTKKMISDKKLTLFPIGVGDGANLETLANFTPKRTAMKLKGLCFAEFFEWLSSSVEKTSASMPGEKVSYDTDTISDFALKYSADTRKIEPWPDELP